MDMRNYKSELINRIAHLALNLLMYTILSKVFGNGRLFSLKSTSISTFSGSCLCSGHVEQYFKRVICTAQEGTSLQNQVSHENGGGTFSGFIPIKELEISYIRAAVLVDRMLIVVCVNCISSFKYLTMKYTCRSTVSCLHGEMDSPKNKRPIHERSDCLDKLRYSIRESEKKLNVKTPDAETLELIKWRQITLQKRIEAKRWRAQLKMTNDDF
ncbi:Pentatricopeptide repeat-containing protein MRL1,chloroplastic [Trichinella pseudospiralis]